MRSRHMCEFKLWLLLLFLVFTFSAVDSWRRRRRRRYVPPPPVNCVVSGWSIWGSCSGLCTVGSQSRTRSIITPPAYGGTSCPTLGESQQCGQYNGGCAHNCNNGGCSCRTGYDSSGTSCYDRDECASNGGRGPCDHVCVNTAGSYHCQCNAGYSLASNQHSCNPLDCGAVVLSSCPSNTYKDNFMDVCKKASSVCPSGTVFNQQCTLQCPLNYRLAKILPDAGQPFAKDYSKVDFSSVQSTVTCSLDGSGVKWNHASEMKSWYCRRANDPPFGLSISRHKILEHSPKGTVIGNLSSQDPQVGQTFTYSVQLYGNLVFFKIQGDQLVNEWIPVLNGPILLNNGSVDVTIRVSDSGTPTMWMDKKFTVFVENVNDPPHSLGLSSNDVNESASIGDIVGELTALDGDDPFGTLPHSDKFIWILVNPDNNFFRLDGEKIVINRSLNHESKNRHIIEVRCTDFGNPPKSVTKNLIINVLNTNDRPLSIAISKSTVDENSPNGTLVGNFIASDEDKDPLDFDISYSDLITLQTFKLGQKAACRVNGQMYTCTQELRVQGHLDYESKRSYIIVVTVNDSFSHLTKAFNISVVNVNEQPTELHFNGPQSISENTPVDSIIGAFMVVDPDNINGPVQTHTCQVIPSADSANFKVSQKVQLKVQQFIDYETTPTLSISVKCVDSGNPSQEITKNFSFSVTDVNEPPTELTISNNTVPENSPNLTVVGVLSSDDQEKHHQNFTYDITGPPGLPFKLGGADGKTLLVSGPIDYEVTPHIDLYVRVTDSGGLSLEKQLRIIVQDVNDPPVDIQVSNPNIKENSGVDVLISPVNVIDQDGNVKGCQLLDDAGGRVKLIGMNLVAGSTVTDYEALDKSKALVIKLNCSDTDGESLTKSFNISVLDVNEPPTALHLELYRSSVVENKRNVEVGRILVNDPDIGQSHLCSVTEAKSGGSKQLFTVVQVNNKTVLKTNRGLDFEANIYHSVVVYLSCSDVVPRYQPRYSIEREFNIHIKDENEVPSGHCNKTLSIPYLASNGSIVGPLFVSDPDNAEFDKKLTAKPKQTLFVSGVLTSPPSPIIVLDGNLVRSGEVEKDKTYTVSVKVEDNGFIVDHTLEGTPVFVKSPSKSSVFNCTVIIEGEDNFVKDILLQPNTVSQTARNGTVIGSLSTITQYPNETFTYTMLEEGQLPFAVIGTQLVVTASDLMDYQASMTPQVQITISSYGSKSGKIVKNFYIIIIDYNEKPGNMCLLHNTVKENQPAHTAVGQIIIEDPDHPYVTCSQVSSGQTLPSQSNYNCHVVNGSNVFDNLVSSQFIVDSSLMLRTTRSLNYEIFALVNGSVSVHIFCTDPVHSIRQTFVVHITDEPDSPTDLQLTCCADVSCFQQDQVTQVEGEPLKQCQVVPDAVINSQPGHLIGYIKPRDEDAGDVFTFSLENMTSYFEVKPVRGSLGQVLGILQVKNENFTVKKDKEVKVYPVTITAEDKFQLSFTKTILLVNKDVCKDNNCVSVSSCRRHPDLKTYSCICPQDWRGNGLKDGTGCTACGVGQIGDRNNECHEINECVSNPCLNQGTCVDGTYSYTCKCKPGFTGKRCETDIDHCQSKPCKNKGDCENQPTQFVCNCIEGFAGKICDRQPSLCKECQDKEDTLCVTFKESGMRCVGPDYQIAIINNQGPLTSDQMYKMEEELAQTLDNNFDSLQSRRRRSVSRFYVEALQEKNKNNTETNAQALLLFAALDITKNYVPIKATDACKALANSNYRCPSNSDCKDLAKQGISCPMGYGSETQTQSKPGLSTGGMAGIGVGAIIVIIALLMGAIFYYRRKYKRERAHHDDTQVHFSAADEHLNFDNPLYGTASPKIDARKIEGMLSDHMKKGELVIGNLDPNSVKKRNDVKVLNNQIYLEPGAEHGAVAGAAAAQSTDTVPNYESIDDMKVTYKNHASSVDLNCGKALGRTFDKTASDSMYESLRKVKKQNQVQLAPDDDIDHLKAAAKGEKCQVSAAEPRYVDTVPRKANMKQPLVKDIEGLEFPMAEQGANAIYENIVPSKSFEDLETFKATVKAEAAGRHFAPDTTKKKNGPERVTPKAKEAKRKHSNSRKRSTGNNFSVSSPMYEALDSIANLDTSDTNAESDA